MPQESQRELRFAVPAQSPLMVRLEPQPRELFRSFLARTGRACETSYPRMLQRLGITSNGATSSPAWLGVTLTNAEAEALGKVLRHEPQTLLDLQLPIHRAPNPAKVKHPQRYRACADCQNQHGAWMRWNADPLRIICPIHTTLFRSEGPNRQKLRNDQPFKERNNWTTENEGLNKTIHDFFALQELLRHHRLQHPKIVRMFTKILIAYQRAATQTPDSEQLAFITEKGKNALAEKGNAKDLDELRERVSTTQSIWASVEDTVAIFPAAATFILEAVLNGRPHGYNELVEDLKDLAQTESINTSSAAAYEDAVISGPSDLYELDHYYDKWVLEAHLHRPHFGHDLWEAGRAA